MNRKPRFYHIEDSMLFKIFSLVFFIGLLFYTGYQLKVRRDESIGEARAAMEDARARLNEAYRVGGSFQSRVFRETARFLLDRPNSLLLLAISAPPGGEESVPGGLLYVLARDRSYLFDPPAGPAEVRDRLEPRYNRLLAHRFTVPFLPRDAGPQGGGPPAAALQLDAVYSVLDREELFPILRDVLIILFAFVLAVVLFILIALSTAPRIRPEEDLEEGAEEDSLSDLGRPAGLRPGGLRPGGLRPGEPRPGGFQPAGAADTGPAPGAPSGAARPFQAQTAAAGSVPGDRTPPPAASPSPAIPQPAPPAGLPGAIPTGGPLPQPAGTAASPRERTLFSPGSGLVWSEYLDERLRFELDRAASFDQDLVLAVIAADPIQAAREEGKEGKKDRPLSAESEKIYRRLARAVLDRYPLRDLAFEQMDWTIALILPDKSLDQAMADLESFRQSIQGARWETRDVTVTIGLSSRSGRLISQSTLVREARAALSRARRDGGNLLTAFRADPDKFRRVTTPH